jgi:beta-glucosidase/6-phospho-beta-glucosidase/beta-galactosidase
MTDHGLEPMVTLHHFTTPLWLTHRGGWENPATIPLFERFAEKMARALGEYCNLWITLKSLTDNFEWAEGWNLRFGLIEVDPVTQERRILPSGQIYSAMARLDGVSGAAVSLPIC